MEYNFKAIEEKWQQYWQHNKVYAVQNPTVGAPTKPKFYVLDMFPYPSGAGLHVGHPLGYIASDIYSRYKRHSGYNVLHPMGFDAFGLPAEQHALETGQHPAHTTAKNTARYRQQLDNIGFCFDWDRSFQTCEPSYYKWTQWIFLQLFESWYNPATNRTEPISRLISQLETQGTQDLTHAHKAITAQEWYAYSEVEKRAFLMHFRIAYLDYAEVWWCEALGTVLANDEVINGFSERGNHPVVKKKMRQWFLRITAFADRLLESLNHLDWTDAMKEMQRNWIGKSTGASVQFNIDNNQHTIEVFTTRPDTIFGVDFLVLAPEHALVPQITTDDNTKAINDYITYVKSRSERDRMTEVKQITGCATGAYALHPFTGKKLPIWISEYVLAGYGTGAIMAVPSGDDRDHAFAQHFKLPITNVFGDLYNGENAYSEKTGTISNSDFLSGLPIAEAIATAIKAIEAKGIGTKKVNFRLRDAGFSRQRYWGEPFPILFKGETPYGVDELVSDELPITLPHVDSYKPGPEGQGPLANLTDWVNTPHGMRETNTMPGYAGSSWYFLRYMDPHNEHTFADRAATDYWQQVDLYVGGTEHAVGHLLYARMWTKALHDLGYIGFDEPFKRLLNQGMIQGSSRFVYRVAGTNHFVSHGLKNKYETSALHVDVSIVDDVHLNIEAFKSWRTEYQDATFELENGAYICGAEVEKMSKSKYNVVNPDDIILQYGADTFRMYEMFLGPIDMSKPWDTKGIEGVYRFVKKLWRLYADETKGWIVTTEAPTDAENKVLHKTIKKITEHLERFSFNTCISQFMITVNELTTLQCHKAAILEPLAVVLSPFAPHVAEELWHHLGHTTTIVDAPYPTYEERFVVDNTKVYPVAINGKPRAEMEFALDMDEAALKAAVLTNDAILKYTEGKEPKKFIYVKGKMINIVI